MRKLMVFVMIAVLLMTGSAFAATVNGALAPSASVPESCSVVTGAPDTTLSDYTGAAHVTSTADYTFKCRKNTTFEIFIVTDNTLQSGPDSLSYELCVGGCDGAGAGASSNLYPTATTGTLETAASSANAVRTIGIRIPSGQTTQPVGTYSDTATLTIQY